MLNELRPSIPGWIIDFVALDGDAIYTDSRKVAAAYGKNHFHVLRDIRELLAVTGDESNFGLIALTDGSGRQQPAYRLTRDGFLLLAMGFTGARAIKLRATFIEAFGWMARELLLRRADDYECRDMRSRVSGTVGACLLNQRKREKPALDAEERLLRAELQITLPFTTEGPQ
jgi:Rha family phage regulatory protein